MIAAGERAQAKPWPWLFGTTRVDFGGAASAAGVSSRRVHILRTLAGDPRCRVAGSAAPAERPHDTGQAPNPEASGGAGKPFTRSGGLRVKEEAMKGVVSIGVAVCLILTAAVPAQSQSNQLVQGTQIHLVLLNGLSTSVARDGDPFTAVVSEPVYIGGQLVLPAGARVVGQVGTVVKPKRFSMFRGQAAMNLTFRSIELDHREIPVQMSILNIQGASAQSNGGKRKDVKLEEGQVVQAKRDIKGDIVLVTLGTGGGTVVGAIFSHVVRGLAFGLIGSTTYVMARKGKGVELPAQTALLVRLDSNITLPTVSARVSPYTTNPR